MSRVGKVLAFRTEKVPQATTAQATSKAEGANIHITNISGYAASSAASAMLGSTITSPAAHQIPLVSTALPQTETFRFEPPEPEPPLRDDEPLELEEFNTNPQLRRFRVKRIEEVEFVVDVEFLEHLIRVLIERHNIVVDAEDVEAIMSYFGECVVKTHEERIMTRGVDVGCCGCSKAEQEKVMKVVKSVVVNGLNLVKHVPALLEFMRGIGLSF
jgi:hypothetical protein